MPTSTGLMRDMEMVGTLFTLKGQALPLGAFVEAGAPPDALFVLFTDLTSGAETYQAGRYLELARNATGIYIVDFNRAFHPHCYYNPSYDCPYPPPSNRLPFVRAGREVAASTIPSVKPLSAPAPGATGHGGWRLPRSTGLHSSISGPAIRCARVFTEESHAQARDRSGFRVGRRHPRARRPCPAQPPAKAHLA